MRTKIVRVSRLTHEQIERMYHLMTRYYEKVSRDSFDRDLAEKHHVILLLDREGELQGFSTILETTLDVGGEKSIALFSGDTVLDRAYWGNGALPAAFGRCLIRAKIRNPFRKVHWFLISKGYRTYLLMTNNFPVHFPRFERKTPEYYKQLMRAFYQKRYGTHFDEETGLIRFQSQVATCLRPAVSEITQELTRHPRIAFFARANPDWQSGVELACVAEVTLWIPFKYAFKRLKKLRTFKKEKAFAADAQALSQS